MGKWRFVKNYGQDEIYFLAIVKKLLEVNLAPLPDSPENDRREFHKMQPRVAELMLP